MFLIQCTQLDSQKKGTNNWTKTNTCFLAFFFFKEMPDPFWRMSSGFTRDHPEKGNACVCLTVFGTQSFLAENH